VRFEVRTTALSRIADVFVWLGGGSRHDIDEPAERSTYQTAGLVVAVNVVVTVVVVHQVATQLGTSSAVRVVFALVAGALVGALGRVSTTAAVQPDRSRSHRLGTETARLLVAVLLGLALGETAAVGAFAGAVDAEMLVQRNAAGAAVTEGPPAADLVELRADRGTMDAQVAAASARRDQALVVARCEYRPSPGCPVTRITGDPGRGPETAQAQADLAAAERNLNAVTARRDQLDRAIAGARNDQADDRSVARALAGSNTGLDARWSAMNSYTVRTGGPLVLRVGLDVLLVLLMALPLLLRWWRGQTEQDHELLSRSLRRRAEREAETAVAVSRARQRVALELQLSAAVQEQLMEPETARAVADAAAAGRLPRAPAAVTAGTRIGPGNSSDPTTRRSAERDAHSPGPVEPADVDADDEAEPQVTAAFVGPAERAAPAASVSDRTPGTDIVVADAVELEPVDHPGIAALAERRPTPSTPSVRETSQPPRAPAARTPLDLLPGPLPSAVRVVGALMRPFVPGPVARIAATAPRSVRIARGLWEEVEEVQITVRQHRKVRSATDEFDEQTPAEPDLAPAHEADEAAPPGRTAPGSGRSRASADRSGAEVSVADPEARSRTWVDAEVVAEPRSRSRRRQVEPVVAAAELADPVPDPAPAVRGRARRSLPPADTSGREDQDD
jgi:hypothetical protein